jgi:transketolase
MFNRGLGSSLDAEMLTVLRDRAHAARGTVLTATTLAASGHPGGSFSSMEIYTLLYSLARLMPAEPGWEERDRIVVSHGHTSPGAYAALAEAGFFPAEEVAAHFRQAGSVFEGHVERSVPGIEWSSGNLGQGLSAGVGFAIGAKLTGARWHTYVTMSDAEQMKGQVAEARRLAAMRKLDNITAIVDWNHVQISGHTEEVMRVSIPQDWEADGWKVYECDGHDLEALHAAVASAADDGVPSVVLARTVIGHGVSFMQDKPEFHGRGLTKDEYREAMTELGLDSEVLALSVVRRAMPCGVLGLDHRAAPVPLNAGTPRQYTSQENTDNRSAWGHALVDIADSNPDAPIAVLDCDLKQSVKTEGFAALHPGLFIECGVGEHNAATVAGALSTVPGVVAFWADFGVFGIDEVYNQHRLNDINGAAVKLVVTHCGLDVGEDGKTHQCIDYVGAMRDLLGWKVIVPADPNQTDRAVRAAVEMPGNVAIAMGRSKLPVVLAGDGTPLFGPGYEFRYGEVAWAREGADACVLTMGTVAGAAVKAADALREEGISVAVGICATPLHIDDTSAEKIAAYSRVITAEDHAVGSGLGATVAETLARRGAGARLTRHGVSEYQSSGASHDLLARAGLDAAGIAAVVRDALG